MLVQVGDEVRLALQLPLQLLRVHEVGVALLAVRVLVFLHAVVRWQFLMIIGRRASIELPALQFSGSIRGIDLADFHNGQNCAA